jgi:hypothetical protein
MLWSALGENRFQATGISTVSGERTVIPDHDWHDLMAIQERGRDVLRIGTTRGTATTRGYDEVAFMRQNIMAIWQPHRPLSVVAPPSELEPYRTGGPGRPTAMHLVLAEHHARWQRGVAVKSVRQESRHLSQWLQVQHPSAPRLTPKAIENRIRGEHRARLGETRN